MNKNYPTGFDINDIADALTNIFGEANEIQNLKLNELIDVPYSYNAKDGIVSVEAVVAGQNPDFIKVKYNDSKHVLRITDEFTTTEETPWYFIPLNLEFTLPETTNSSTFLKTIENGVLTVTVCYDEEKKTCADIEI